MPIAIIEPLRTMTPVAVQSSSLTQVAYEHRKAILRVEFRDGSAYQYANVPLRTYHDLLRADSKGAYFNHHRLVGFEFGPGDVPAVRTAAGLKLGDPLSRARLIYAHKLTTSGVNGGAWFAATATGRIDGFLTWNGAYGPSPTSKIFTIDVGDVGCPAMSP